MHTCFVAGSGALLGDDMGLGKTIQVIGLVVALLGVAAVKDSKPEFLHSSSHGGGAAAPPGAAGGVAAPQRRGAALIVVPSAVLYNWAAEITRWSYLRLGMVSAKVVLGQC